jgi:drug/metabolite transporter (DMT)-like permease
VIASSSPAWALWLALALAVVGLVLWAVVFVMARRLWRQLKPQLEPLLAMFLPQQPSGGDVVQRISEYTDA